MFNLMLCELNLISHKIIRGLGKFPIQTRSHQEKANTKVKKIKEQSEEIKEKIQTSKKNFTFTFAFAQCERTLMRTNSTPVLKNDTKACCYITLQEEHSLLTGRQIVL